MGNHQPPSSTVTPYPPTPTVTPTTATPCVTVSTTHSTATPSPTATNVLCSQPPEGQAWDCVILPKTTPVITHVLSTPTLVVATTASTTATVAVPVAAPQNPLANTGSPYTGLLLGVGVATLAIGTVLARLGKGKHP